MEILNPFAEKINYVYGVIVTLLSMIFGRYWWMFAFFLAANILDYITGWMKFKTKKTESSVKGLQGVIKKLAYWIMILMAFWMSTFFHGIGEMLHVDLKITAALGWFVLATLFINEVRSILENLVECGVHVPSIFIQSLEVANKALHKEDGSLDVDLTSNEEKDIYRINLDIPLEELENKEEIRLKINKVDEANKNE